MRLAICDDNESCLAVACDAVAEYAKRTGDSTISVTAYSHAEDLISAVHKSGGFDVYILDIVMPHVNGIELGMTLRNDGYTGKIVYLTSSEEFALESYRVKAHDYLMKPLDKDKLFALLDELYAQLKDKDDKSIIVKTKTNSVKLSLDSILYAELNKRAIVYRLTNGKTVEGVTLRIPFSEAVKPLIADGRFIVCGQSMVSNLRHITMVENDAIVFNEKIRVPLGVKICREIRSVWADFWLNKEAVK